MKTLFTIFFSMLSLLQGQAQVNKVFSGGELINYNVVDIATVAGQTWSTERSALPGYFSAVDSAAYTGCSNDAFVDGYMKKYGNQPFIFPIGNASKLRTLGISAPSISSDAYATAWIAGNPSGNLDPTAPFAGAHPLRAVRLPISDVSDAGQWDWQVGEAGNLGEGTTGTGIGLTITVSIPDLTAFAEASALRLVGWNGTQWIDLSGSATASGNTENSTLKGIMVAHISAIAIGKVMVVLPLKLESFTATSVNCNTELNWATSSEFNTSQFIVEQSSDAITYYAIASVPASGSASGSQYNTIVSQPPGISYYRLKIKNNDGSFIYSAVVQFRNNCSNTTFMQVYPNPVSTGNPVINLSFSTAYRGQAAFTIFNSISQQVITKTIQVTEGKNLVSANVTGLPAGTYFIRVTGENGNQIGNGQKFIKQ